VNDPALRLLLQAVVADGRRGVERLGDVARIELIHRAGVVSPHAGIAVGLQLHAHRNAVLLGLRTRARRFHLLEGAGLLLHVVTDLVRDDVGLREVARSAEAPLQIAEEREVEVELLVAGTVERPHRGLAHAARRAHLPVVQHECRCSIARPRSCEQIAPHILGAAQHLGHELPQLILGRSARHLLRGTGALGRHLLGNLGHHSGIDAEEVGNQRDDDSADAQPAADHADAAPVLDVATFALVA